MKASTRHDREIVALFLQIKGVGVWESIARSNGKFLS